VRNSSILRAALDADRQRLGSGSSRSFSSRTARLGFLERSDWIAPRCPQ
jgi:hypothetical protein